MGLDGSEKAHAAKKTINLVIGLVSCSLIFKNRRNMYWFNIQDSPLLLQRAECEAKQLKIQQANGNGKPGISLVSVFLSQRINWDSISGRGLAEAEY